MKIPTLQWRAVHLRLNLQWCHILITHPANSMSTQIFYYMPIHYPFFFDRHTTIDLV